MGEVAEAAAIWRNKVWWRPEPEPSVISGRTEANCCCGESKMGTSQKPAKQESCLSLETVFTESPPSEWAFSFFLHALRLRVTCNKAGGRTALQIDSNLAE